MDIYFHILIVIFQKAGYITIRKAIIDLHQRILKILKPDEIKTCAWHLGLLHQKTLTFKNDTETDLLTDYMVYSYHPNGFNMAEKYLRLNKSRLSKLGQFPIQSGASLPVDKPLMMAEEVQRVLQNFGPNSSDHFLLHPANNAKLARATITAAIRLGYTDNVRYHEV